MWNVKLILDFNKLANSVMEIDKIIEKIDGACITKLLHWSLIKSRHTMIIKLHFVFDVVYRFIYAVSEY